MVRYTHACSKAVAFVTRIISQVYAEFYVHDSNGPVKDPKKIKTIEKVCCQIADGHDSNGALVLSLENKYISSCTVICVFQI
jgi:hypothetical protein